MNALAALHLRIALSVWFLSSLLVGQALCEPARHFDLRTSIAMTTFATSLNTTSGAILSSPDGEYEAFVSSRGLLESNRVESSLWIVRNRDLQTCLTAKREIAEPCTRTMLARFARIPQRQVFESRSPVIFELHWTADSSALYFLLDDGPGLSLYKAVLATRRVVRLSMPNEDVQQYALSTHQLVYAAILRGKASEPARTTGPRWIGGISLPDLILPESRISFSRYAVPPRIWRISDQGGRSLIRTPRRPDALVVRDSLSPVFSLSPNGRYLVRAAPFEETNSAWSEYVPTNGYPDRKIDPSSLIVISPSNRWRLRRYVLTDLDSGQTRVLLDAPLGTSLGNSDWTDAVWSSDGQRILLGNTTLPLPESGLAQAARSVCSVVSVDLSGRQQRCVALSRDAAPAAAHVEGTPSERVRGVSFGAGDDEVVLRVGWRGKPRLETYREGATGWQLISDATDESATIADTKILRVRESLDAPPELWGRLPGHPARCIWNPNPELKGMDLGRTEIFEWKDASDYRWRGILLTPSAFDPTREYPLVIQTHGAPDDRFLIDGKYSTAEAARVLAGLGFVVLQMPYRADHVGTPQEAPDQVAGFQAAIDVLEKYRNIAPGRIGITAFSRTGFHIEQALTGEPNRFAAAVIADATTSSYMAYRLFSQGETFVSNDIGNFIGATPEGEGMQTWMKRASDFNVDRIHTPLLLQASGPTSLLMEWELYASLQQQKKQVEALYFSGGQHVLQKPQEVFASQQASISWFVQWLQHTAPVIVADGTTRH